MPAVTELQADWLEGTVFQLQLLPLLLPLLLLVTP